MISDNITRDADGTLRFAGHSADELADTFGTPLYLMDEKRIRDNCRMYLAAFREHFGENSAVLYAAKACAFKAICRIAAEEGMGLDAVSVGEIHTALEAGFPADRIYFHGDAKTDDDIRYALDRNVGCFVVDNETELEALSAETKRRSVRQKVLLRVTPGIDPHTYEAVNTGTVDVKFGVPIETGQALEFVRRALDEESLDVAGLHCHVGSEVFDEDVFERTCDVMTAFMARLRRELGYTARELDLGGGYGVRYVESDPRADIPARIGEVASHLKRILGEAKIYEDGSACFRVPAKTPVYFQIVNQDGHVIQTMRSWSTLQPGETFSCVGCHEDKNSIAARGSFSRSTARPGGFRLRRRSSQFWTGTASGATIIRSAARRCSWPRSVKNRKSTNPSWTFCSRRTASGVS